MSTEIKISTIITASDGDAPFLEQCLGSLLDQSLKEIEVLCVVNESSVDLLELLDRYSTKDGRVFILRSNAEPGKSTRDVGLQAAKGKYIHFLDAHDYVLDFAYEALYRKLEKYELDYLRFCGIAYDEAAETTVAFPECDLNFLREGDFNRLLSPSYCDTALKLCAPSYMGIYRRSFLVKNGITPKGNGEPAARLFFYETLAHANRVMAARDRLVFHRMFASAQSDEDDVRRIREQVSLLGEISLSLAGNHEALAAASISELRRLADLFDRVSTRNPQLDSLSDEVERCMLGYKEDFIRGPLGAFKRTRKRLRRERLQLAETSGEDAATAIKSITKKTNASPTPLGKPTRVFFEKCTAPKVSVVVPIFNQEEYLNQALHSLAIQTLEDIEFICVNDGSKDASMVIMREYENIDKRFRIIDKPNTGYGNSMNVGIDAACGEYLGILEPDDFVPANMFKDLYRIAHRENLDLVKADFHRFWIAEDGATKKRLFRLTNNASYYGRVVNTSEELESFNFVMNTWSGIYKLEFLNRWGIRHNETPGASYQDNGFWFQTFGQATRAWFVNTPYYMNRRDNPNSSMFDTGKFYAVTREYEFIKKWIDSDPQRLGKLEPLYHSKKFSNFMVTYYRLAREQKKNYLRHLRDEFMPAMEAGKLDEGLFGELRWKLLNDMMTEPDAFDDRLRVSAIIPAYNAAEDITACLDSILARDEIRFEVIVVDDGSTDDTLNILRDYAKRDERVRVFAQQNAGAGAARNNGMRHAGGDYLAFLDADDFFEPDMIRRAWEKAYAEDSDVVVFRSDNYDENSGIYSGMSYTIRNDLLPHQRPFAGVDIEEDIFKAFVGWPWDKLFRTEFVRENKLLFQEQRTTNDLLFVFSAIARANQISIVGAVLAHHRRKALGATLSVSREKSWDCFYWALVALRRQLKEWELYERFERDFINYSLHACLWNLHTLHGASYFSLYAALNDRWFEDLGISGKDGLYFYTAGEYEDYLRIASMNAEEYLFVRLNGALADAEKNRKRADGLSARLKESKSAANKANRKLRTAESKLESLKKSNSWRIGRVVTWLPRKLKAFCNHRNLT